MILLKNKYFILLLIYFIGFTIYFDSLNYGYILDDIQQVVNNPLVTQIANLYKIFSNSTMASAGEISGIYYKPIMMISYNFLWQIGNGNSFYFHLFQLVLHCTNAFLIYLLFLKIDGREKYYLPLFVSLIFLCHPINAESVLFIADLQEPLFTFFGLIAVLTLLNVNIYISVLATIFFLLCSLLSKESGLLYVLIVLLYSLIFKKNKFKKIFIGIVFIIFIYLYLRFEIAGLNTVSSDNMAISRADMLTRFITIPKVLMHYIHLFFYPQLLSLTQDWIVTKINFLNFWIYFLEASTIFVGSIIYFIKTKNKLFLFYFIWFLLGWLMHSQIIPLDGTVSDRWFYFTIIGFSAMISTLFNIDKYLNNTKYLGLFFLILIALSYRTYTRSLNWKNALTLYAHDVSVSPETFYLNNNYGLALLDAQKPAEAIPYFEKTIWLTPINSASWYAANLNISYTYLQIEQYEKAHFYVQIALAEKSLKAFRMYSLVLNKQEKYVDLKLFLTEVALIKFPTDSVLLKIYNSVNK